MTPTDAERAAVLKWIETAAHPLTTVDPAAPLDDLRPLLAMVGDASIVGYGAGTRGAHELFTLQTRIARLLVEEGAFRAVALEVDTSLGLRLDEYVRTGRGDPNALLKAAGPLAATEEVFGLLSWMHAFNRDHPERPVRLVGIIPGIADADLLDGIIAHISEVAPSRVHEVEALYAELRPTPEEDPFTYIGRLRKRQDIKERARDAHLLVAELTADSWTVHSARLVVQFLELHDHDAPPDDPHNMACLERCYAENLSWWHAHLGEKALWWTSSSHSSNGPGRAMRFPPAPARALPNAGGFLRERLGPGYVSIGLTFQRGELNAYAGGRTYQVPDAAPELFESFLASGDFLLDLRADGPPEAAAWLTRPAFFRAIGPVYDPANDAAHHMTGGSPAEWFEIVLHLGEVTPTRQLP
ncbi:erythromycin esterase family protein [Actinocorallia sp. A-T 12471]|uniref:erythromycin esterase family protein n=1 Tax=Actinocorallia sp. A-T 12471 TaxID=3089813 RepID=UPI0029CC7B47|nr:erythromycin esterase family protein [Actinocorallia sp. A-T 12471]MDX6741415.1 erythromycin esterase family protein [Actinocorallia sp. A-T 12471]